MSSTYFDKHSRVTWWQLTCSIGIDRTFYYTKYTLRLKAKFWGQNHESWKLPDNLQTNAEEVNDLMTFLPLYSRGSLVPKIVPLFTVQYLISQLNPNFPISSELMLFLINAKFEKYQQCWMRALTVNKSTNGTDID